MGQLRRINCKKAIKAFIKAGGTIRKGKGDHINIKMQNGQIITLPCSSDLKVGLLRAAIKKAGLTVEDFQILIE